MLAPYIPNREKIELYDIAHIRILHVLDPVAAKKVAHRLRRSARSYEVEVKTTT